MGESKSRREETRAALLVEFERWMEPTSPEEGRLNDEISALQFYEVHRALPEQLAQMGMKPQESHQNAAVYVRLDPSGESRHVSGWWRRGGIFFFHSVVLTQGKLHCITPHPDPSPLSYAPDFDIVWRETGGLLNAERRGREVPYLVRNFPDQVIAAAKTARDALLAGADPSAIRAPIG